VSRVKNAAVGFFKRRKPSLIGGTLVLLMPNEAGAHIKWFCAYDTSIPPLPIRDVITPTFAAVAIGFCTLMFIAYVIDRMMNASARVKRIDDAIFRLEAHTGTIIRFAVGILFVELWDSGGLILTPELKTASPFVPWVQLAIAASMLFRPTLVLGAAGIMGLYTYAVAEYGAFHMMDYPVFPGVAVYLGLATVRSSYLQALRLPVLYSSVAATMMWGAIEKFGYPYWTLPLLTTHAALTLGLNFEQFMYIAGFVEFSLAFFMLTGTALLRLSCAALVALLVSAVPAFGRIDAIGHLLIIAILVVMIIAGQRTINMPPALARTGTLKQAGILTLGYSMTIVVTFGLYYGSQSLAGR
jgi:hypothetical protein